jgi:hypothetical protein
MNESEVINFYDALPKKFRQEERDYPAKKELGISLPFRMCIVGSTGSGKTNFLMNLVRKMNAFTRIMLFAKDLEEPLYASFIDLFRKIEKETNTTILIASNKIEEIPPVSTTNKQDNTLLIIDDMMTEKHDKLAPVVEYWIRGRKQQVSCCYLAQAYHAIPSNIRKNSDYLVLTKIKTLDDLHRILREYTLGTTKEEIERMYNEAAEFPHVFMIDTATKDQAMRFRRDYRPMAEPAPQIEKAREIRSREVGGDDEEDLTERPPVKKRRAVSARPSLCVRKSQPMKKPTNRR